MMAMNEYDVRRLAQVLAVQAEIEGMKAHNKICELNGNTDHLYCQSFFDEKGKQLSNLANSHNEQL